MASIVQIQSFFFRLETRLSLIVQIKGLQICGAAVGLLFLIKQSMSSHLYLEVGSLQKLTVFLSYAEMS
jgi:hypothetical protein